MRAWTLLLCTYHVGEDIGAAEGELDDYKGYRAMERMEKEHDGGRHVMAIDGRLVDGVTGFSGAQYINSAYRVKGWCNKAEMLDGGTIRVMRGRVINAGEEILMAYHSEYWRRWAPRQRKRARDGEAGASGVAAAADGGDAEEGIVVATPAAAESPTAWDVGDDGRGYGRRIRGDASNVKPSTGGKRGRPPKPADAASSNSTKRRKSGPCKLLWTDTGREEYCRKIARTGSGDSGGVSGRRFERGEGGGVT